MELYVALGVSGGDVVAFAGAGGKSTAILAVAAELRGAGLRVLAVPTTRMTLSEARRVGEVLTSEDPDELGARVKEVLGRSGAAVAGSAMISKRRVGGLEPGLVAPLAELADVTLVEADGSRRRPIKGTDDHEPVLPGAATLVVGVANVEAFGKPVAEEHVHRPEVFSRLTGLGPGQSITARAFARAISEGSLRRVPEGARKAALITGVRPGPRMADAAIVARELWRSGIRNVVLSSLPDESPGRVWVP